MQKMQLIDCQNRCELNGTNMVEFWSTIVTILIFNTFDQV